MDVSRVISIALCNVDHFISSSLIHSPRVAFIRCHAALAAPRDAARLRCDVLAIPLALAFLRCLKPLLPDPIGGTQQNLVTPQDR